MQGRRINIYARVQPLKGDRYLSIRPCVRNPKQPGRQDEAEGIAEVVEGKQTSQKSKWNGQTYISSFPFWLGVLF